MAIPLQYDIFARDRASRTFSNVSRSMGSAERRSRSFAASFARVGGAIGAAATAAAGAAGALGLKTAASLQQSQIAFETLLGSAERARSFLGDLQKFAATTPFEMPGLVDASRQLIGAGAAAQQVIPTLTAWGDAAGALGLGQEQFNRIMLAVTQSMSKGKVQAEELMQMTEAGIPIWPLLARAMNKTVPELQALSREGKLLAADVFPALEKQMGRDYGGAMARQAQTLTGLWSTFMDTLNIGLANVIQPLLPVLQNAMPAAMTVLGQSLQGLAGWVRGTAMPALMAFRDFFVTEMLPRLREFGAFLRADAWPALRDFATTAIPIALDALVKLSDALSGALRFFRRHEEILGPLAVAVAGYATVVWGVARATQAWATAQVAVNAAMLRNPYVAATAAVVGMTAALVKANEQGNRFHDSVMVPVAKATGHAFSAVASGITTVADKSLERLGAVAKGMDWLVTRGGAVEGSIVGVFGSAGRAIDRARGKVQGFDDAVDRAVRDRVLNIGVRLYNADSVPAGVSLRQVAEGVGAAAPPDIARNADRRIADRLRDQARAIGNATKDAIWDGYEGGMAGVGSAVSKASESASRAVERASTAAQDAADKARQKLEEIRGQFESLRDSVQSSVMGFFELRSEGNPFAGVKQMAAKATRFANALGRLARQGFPPGLIAQIAQAGPEVGFRAATMLANASKSNQGIVRNAYTRIERAANRAGTTVATAQYGDQLAVARRSEGHLARIAKAVERKGKPHPLEMGWAGT